MYKELRCADADTGLKYHNREYNIQGSASEALGSPKEEGIG